jgi:hypothetical protein
VYEKPKKKEDKDKKKKSSVNFEAAIHVKFMDEKSGREHMGDMFLELLGKEDDVVEKKLTDRSHGIEHFRHYEDFLKNFFKTSDLQVIKKQMYNRFHDGKSVPIWDIDDQDVKVVSTASQMNEIRFASEENALQFLADMTNETVEIAE